MGQPAARFGIGLCLLAATLLGSLAGPAHGDPATGRALAKAKCQACHGIDGLALVPDAPNLAGQKRAYLASQLWAFRSGERQNPKMATVILGLSDDDIIHLADWYASIPIRVEMPQ